MTKSETVNIGFETVEQTLLGGVEPVTKDAKDAETIKARAAQALTSCQVQKPCTVGLFDDVGRAQRDLF